MPPLRSWKKLRQHKAEIISLLQVNGIPPGGPAEWRKPLTTWLDSACVHHPRCFGGVSCHHAAFCEWEAGRNRVSCNRDTFELLLKELGFLMDEGTKGVVLVCGLTFRRGCRGGRSWLISNWMQCPVGATPPLRGFATAHFAQAHFPKIANAIDESP